MVKRLWSLAVEAIQALHRQYSPAMEEAAAAAGLERPAWFLLLPALIFEPELVSAERLRVRMPYYAAEYYEDGLRALTSKGMIAPQPLAAYRLTAKGRDTLRRILDAAYARMAALAPIPLADQEHLAGLLRRLVEASLAAPEPPAKWSICLSRRTDPGELTAPLIRIDQYLSDLGAYRDDAHLAAWRPFGLNGPTWEAFTLLWRGEADSLDELYQKLAWRRFTEDVYAAVVQDLIDRGWIEAVDGKLCLSARGQLIRQKTEEMTERTFYAPWACLDQVDLAALERLLRQLRDALRPTED